MPRRLPGLRQNAPESIPSRQSSGSGAPIAKALRRSRVNQTCIISLPWRAVASGGQVPFASGLRPRLIPTVQTTCECQRVIGPPGDGPALASLHAVHDPDEHGRAARLAGEDERLGTLRVERRPGAALARALGVEVVRRLVTGPASSDPGLESRALRRAQRRPATGLAADGGEDAPGGRALPGRRERQGRVLLEMPDEATPRARRQPRRPGRERAEDQRLRRRSDGRPARADAAERDRDRQHRHDEVRSPRHGRESLAQRLSRITRTARERLTKQNAPAAKTFAPSRVSW